MPSLSVALPGASTFVEGERPPRAPQEARPPSVENDDVINRQFKSWLQDTVITHVKSRLAALEASSAAAAVANYQQQLALQHTAASSKAILNSNVEFERKKGALLDILEDAFPFVRAVFSKAAVATGEGATDERRRPSTTATKTAAPPARNDGADSRAARFATALESLKDVDAEKLANVAEVPELGRVVAVARGAGDDDGVGVSVVDGTASTTGVAAPYGNGREGGGECAKKRKRKTKRSCRLSARKRRVKGEGGDDNDEGHKDNNEKGDSGRDGGVGSNRECIADSRPRNATLIRTPRNLFILWDEYEFGIDGRVPAREFTSAERGRVKDTYSRRKVVWDVIDQMVWAGYDSRAAIDRIYNVYGHQRVSKIIELLRRDEKQGGGRPEFRRTESEDGKKGNGEKGDNCGDGGVGWDRQSIADGRQSNATFIRRNATLVPTPRDLYTLWDEYEFGIDGRVPARRFTSAERGRAKYTYSRRKVVWDVIDRMVRTGCASRAAIDRIYNVYGHQRVSKIIELLRRDEKQGDGRPEFRRKESEDGKKGNSEKGDNCGDDGGVGWDRQSIADGRRRNAIVDL